MSESLDGGELGEIHLVGVPLDLYARASARHADLLRELTHVGHGSARAAVPARLLQVVVELRESYAGFSGPVLQVINDAMDRGDRSVDVAYALPAAARDEATVLLRTLDATDEFCRSGHLLTLEAPAELVHFRHWYLGEVVRQLAGDAPLPWSEYARSVGMAEAEDGASREPGWGGLRR